MSLLLKKKTEQNSLLSMKIRKDCSITTHFPIKCIIFHQGISMDKEMKRPRLLRRISFPFCSPPSLSCKNQVFSDTSQVVFRIQEVRERVVTHKIQGQASPEVKTKAWNRGSKGSSTCTAAGLLFLKHKPYPASVLLTAFPSSSL